MDEPTGFIGLGWVIVNVRVARRAHIEQVVVNVASSE